MVYIYHSPIEHTRFVYHLQESAAQSDSESDSEPDSDDMSSRGRPRRSVRSGKTHTRMSLLTGLPFETPSPSPRQSDDHADGYFDLGCGHEPWANGSDTPSRNGRRRFFDVGGRWDTVLRKVVLERQGAGADDGTIDIGALMANGGRETRGDSSEPCDEMDVDTDIQDA